VSSHREENIDSDRIFLAWVDLLNNLADRHHLPIIVSTHPRTRKKIDTDGIKFHKLVRLIKPVGFTDYIKLQTSSKAVLSDSGTISEESSILNFPALNIRECQERHEALEEGSVMFVGTNKETVFQGLSILAAQTRGPERVMMPVKDYLSANVSEKIIRLIISYTDYVNRTIWKKY
jgi:UDP-N-acetylglucosamine 2-epimerase (non-hydrolysing)